MKVEMQKTKSLEIDSLLLQHIRREYDAICSLYGIDLKPPVFELFDSTATLGRWNGFNRVLGLSRGLIIKMPWNITLEVLKHEMAHQVCSEIHQMKKLDHGHRFQLVCEALQVKYIFRKAGASLEHLQAEIHNANCYTDEIQNKIKKLLALSRSDNQHESALAMEKARKLMEKHSCLYATEGLEDVVHEVIETQRKRLGLEQSQTMAIISRYFNITVISSWQFNPLYLQQFKAFELIGRQKDVAVAVHCYFFLQQQLAAAWKSSAIKGRKQKGAKNGFVYGMLTGFEEKLAKQFNVEEGRSGGGGEEKSWQPILVNDKDVVEYCRKRFPHLRKPRSRTLQLEHESYNSGVDLGKKLNLYKAMQGVSGQKRLN